MANLFSAVEGKLLLTIKHTNEESDNSKEIIIDAFNDASASPEFVSLLFESFFVGSAGGRTLNGDTGKFIVHLIGKDLSNNDVIKSIECPTIKIKKIEKENAYIFELDENEVVPLIYNDNFYITKVKLIYKSPIPGTNDLSDDIALVESDYPSKCSFAVDVANSDPATKGIFLDPSNPSSVMATFKYIVEISK